MAIRICFPSTLYALTQAWSLEVEGTTLREVIDNLTVQYPDMKKAICASNEIKIRGGLIVSVNGEIVTTIDVPIPRNATIDIRRASSGG